MRYRERVPGARRGNRPRFGWSGSPAQSCALLRAVGPTNPAGSNPPAHSQKNENDPLNGGRSHFVAGAGFEPATSRL